MHVPPGLRPGRRRPLLPPSGSARLDSGGAAVRWANETHKRPPFRVAYFGEDVEEDEDETVASLAAHYYFWYALCRSQLVP